MASRCEGRAGGSVTEADGFLAARQVHLMMKKSTRMHEIIVQAVVADGGIIAGIADINAVLDGCAVRFGIFDGGVIAEISEHAPGIIVGEGAAAHSHMVGMIDAHAGPGGIPDC